MTTPPDFLPFAAHTRDYPAPQLSLLPHLQVTGWHGRSRQRLPSLLDGNATFFSMSRYALAEALCRCGAGPGHTVLVPAYHCRSLVDPVIWVGAKPHFYSLMPDLSPDFSHLDKLAENKNIVAMVLTHYFGFPNAPDKALQYCNKNNFSLIEDCAHSLYSHIDGRPLGSWGKYAIASSWKFLPSKDGALLLDNNKDPSDYFPALHKPSYLAEFKAFLAVLNTPRTRHSPIRPNLIQPDILVNRARQIAANAARQVGQNPSMTTFNAEKARLTGLRFSRLLLSLIDHEWVSERRRANYQRWVDDLGGITNASPLYGSLPNGITPYAFPLLTDGQGLVFHALRSAGIPIWRWEDMARSGCQTSQDYRLRLLQLPCHQSLSKGDMDWMIDVTRCVIEEIGA